MTRYASGKYARALCDRCGWAYPLLQLQKEWNGLKTCPTCWEPKHPQLETRSVSDVTALDEPRPDNQVQLVQAHVRGLNLYIRVLHAQNVSTSMGPEVSGVAGTGAVGTPAGANDALPSGVASTGAVPAENTPFWTTGTNTTGAIGTAIGQSTISINGMAANATVTQVQIGEENISVAVPISGVSSIGAIGVVEPNPGWGVGAYGEGTWGF